MKLSERLRIEAGHIRDWGRDWFVGDDKLNEWADEVAKLEAVVEAARELEFKTQIHSCECGECKAELKLYEALEALDTESETPETTTSRGVSE